MNSSPYEEGSIEAPILLLGEAPSTVEMKERRPFVGPAGTLLEQCLHAAGIARAECYITNVFEDRVYKKSAGQTNLHNKNGELLWSQGKGFQELAQEEVEACLARIRASKAKIIVPLGAVAMALVAPDKKNITKWRGTILKGMDGRKIVPSIHPAACLRGSYVWRYLIAADMKRVKLESQHPEVLLPKRLLITRPSFEEATEALRKARSAKSVATDIEVLTGHVSCFSIATQPSVGISIPIVGEGFRPYWSPEQEAEIWRLYGEIIEDPKIAKVNQNITFDLAFLLQRNHLVPAGLLHDPMVAHSIMNPALPKSLGTLCSLYTREPYYKDDGDLHDNARVEEFTTYWEYNAKDAVIALECWNALEPLLEEDGYRSTYDRTMATIPALIYMMVVGYKVNIEELRATRAEVLEKIKEAVKRLESLTGREIITAVPKTAKAKRAAAGKLNINSPAQLVKYFYGDLKISPYLSKGRPTVDDRALARLFRTHELQEAKALQDYRSLSKLLSTYLEVRLSSDGRLRCSYNPRGTWTGRLSSSKTVLNEGLNMQNLPSAMQNFLEGD